MEARSDVAISSLALDSGVSAAWAAAGPRRRQARTKQSALSRPMGCMAGDLPLLEVLRVRVVAWIEGDAETDAGGHPAPVRFQRGSVAQDHVVLARLERAGLREPIAQRGLEAKMTGEPGVGQPQEVKSESAPFHVIAQMLGSHLGGQLSVRQLEAGSAPHAIMEAVPFAMDARREEKRVGRNLGHSLHGRGGVDHA